MNSEQEILRRLGAAERAYHAGDLPFAEEMLLGILSFDPDNSKANELLAYIHGNRGNIDDTFKLLKKATASENASAEAHYYLGSIYLRRNQFNDAISSFKISLNIGGEFFEGLHDLGVAVAADGQPEHALAIFNKAALLNPNSRDLFYNTGRALDDLHRYDEAMAAYGRAIEIDSNYAEAWYNYGKILADLGRHNEALTCFDKAFRLKPDIDYHLGSKLRSKMMLCDWEGIEDLFTKSFQLINLGKKVATPFSLLATPASPALERKCSEIFVSDKFSALENYCIPFKSSSKEKVRIGYYSADFHNHATAYLIAELLELHNRSKFELVGFSFGPDKRDEMRERISSSMDQFIDVHNKNEQTIAILSRDMGIDIAVDLKGFTQNARTGIFAHRAAPIQVSYLGYPGTMAAPFIDYLIADKVVIDQNEINSYSEKIVFLPNSYQVNDRTRKVSGRKVARTDAGLPETGFVFTCFNIHNKITPDVFDVWMRLLSRIPNSVLWLIEGNRSLTVNLQEQAARRGISGDRLVFAKHMNLDEHLARHQLADLFLDTFYYNAHTTASDALWAGLPLVTRLGKTFASRVASSLLEAIGLGDLVTHTTEEYEALAYELATNPDKLAEIKRRLENNKLTYPLFDTPTFARHLETAYLKMYERYSAGLAPDHLFIQE